MKKRILLALAMGGMLCMLAGCGYNLEGELEKANSLYEAGNIEEAHAKYDEIIENSPRTAEAYIGALKTSPNGINYGAYDEYSSKLIDVFVGIEDIEERIAMRPDYESFYEFVINEAVANDEIWSQREVSADTGVWSKDDAWSMFRDSVLKFSDEKMDELLTANKDYIIGKIDYTLSNGEKWWEEQLIGVIPNISTDQDLVAKVEEVKLHNDEYDKYSELFKDIYEAYGPLKDYQKVADLSEDDKIKELDEKIGDSGCYYLALVGYGVGEPTGNGNMYVAYYNFEGCDCGQFYIGEMQDGKRIGKGDWVWCQNNANGLYVEISSYGTWVDDAPNGEFRHYLNYVQEDGSEYTEQGTYNYVNGLLNDQQEHHWIKADGSQTTEMVTYVNGRPVAEELEPWYREYLDSQGYTEDMGYFYAIGYDDYVNGKGYTTVRGANMIVYGQKYTENGMSHFRKSYIAEK